MIPGADPLFLEFQTALAGRYALERELGRGGMGIVYRARDLRLERVVAIKLLPPQLAQVADRRERFVREARMAAQLSHPNIIPIHAVEEIGDFVFFVMSFVDGETLGARVRRDGALKPHDAARILREVAWALAYAHSQGVVHRDVKPDNILLERAAGRALVADFGIARSVQTAALSGEHELVGTPEYMSPEQASGGGGGEPLDGRSDLYSLGVVGYYILSGHLPFTSPTVAGLLAQHFIKTPPDLTVPGAGAPRQLIAAVQRCMQKDPAQRFQSGEELAAALALTIEGRRELPVPIRAFLSESRSQVRGEYISSFVAAAVLVPLGLGKFLSAVFAGHPPAAFRIGLAVIAVLLVTGAVVAPVVLLLRSVRRLLRAGYRYEDLVHALELELGRRREEQEFTSGGQGPTRWERTMRSKMYASLAIAVVTGASAFFVPYPASLVVFGLFGLSCATAVATGLAARAASRSRLDDAEERGLKFWAGRLGRWLFTLGGLRLGAGSPPVAAGDRPTEAVLGLAALELFEALPHEARRQLGDLPAVVHGLEERVRRLRGDGQDARLGEALGALETIRLDLLRLHGGVGTLHGLTDDLGAAREIGARVDALLGGS